MIQGKYLSVMDDLSGVLNLRNEIFGANVIDSESDIKSVIVTCADDGGVLVGTGRITLDIDDNNDTVFTMDSVGVLENERMKGYGEFVVRLLADKAMLSGAEKLFLTCPVSAKGFFEKLYFKEIPTDADGCEEKTTCDMMVLLSQFKHKCQGCN